MAGPLEGFRVIEWAMFQNGPAAGYMLGDLGAEVIKIEPPVTGDFSRGFQRMYDAPMQLPGDRTAHFEGCNRSKRGIVLNFRSELGREVLYRLVKTSDVFFTNFRKSTARKLGVDYEALRKCNPRLVYATNSAYGSAGPWSEKRSFDPAAQAVSGAMWICGDRDDHEPRMAVGGLFDQTGATILAYGILAALLARERTGAGQEIECSLLSAGIHLQAMNINTFLWQGNPIPRATRHAGTPMYNTYQCQDDKWLLLSEPQADSFWHDFCLAIGLPPEVANSHKFATSQARQENAAEIMQIMDATFTTKTRDEWLRIFKSYEFVAVPINDYEEMRHEPQVLDNQYLVEIDHPTMGRIKTAGCPVQFHRTPVSIETAPPEFGQHTEEVLLELGYGWEEITHLREHEAIG